MRDRQGCKLDHDPTRTSVRPWVVAEGVEASVADEAEDVVVVEAEVAVGGAVPGVIEIVSRDSRISRGLLRTTNIMGDCRNSSAARDIPTSYEIGSTSMKKSIIKESIQRAVRQILPELQLM